MTLFSFLLPFQRRCDRFNEDLESYLRQIEDLKDNGDVEKVEEYLATAQALDAKLMEAADKVCHLFWLLFVSFCLRSSIQFCNAIGIEMSYYI